MTDSINIEKEKKNLSVDLSFKFSLDLVFYTEQLEEMNNLKVEPQGISEILATDCTCSYN